MDRRGAGLNQHGPVWCAPLPGLVAGPHGMVQGATDRAGERRGALLLHAVTANPRPRQPGPHSQLSWRPLHTNPASIVIANAPCLLSHNVILTIAVHGFLMTYVRILPVSELSKGALPVQTLCCQSAGWEVKRGKHGRKGAQQSTAGNGAGKGAERAC